MTQQDIEQEAQYDWMEEARQFAAQCWCDKETQHLVMIPELAEAIAKRISAWMMTGAQHCRNEEYWRGQHESQLQQMVALEQQIAKKDAEIERLNEEWQQTIDLMDALQCDYADAKQENEHLQSRVKELENPKWRSDKSYCECPFCRSLDIGGAHSTTTCYGCGAEIKAKPPLQNSINAWNTRRGIKINHPGETP